MTPTILKLLEVRRCLHCGESWITGAMNQCPYCHSYYWDTERKYPPDHGTPKEMPRWRERELRKQAALKEV